MQKGNHSPEQQPAYQALPAEPGLNNQPPETSLRQSHALTNVRGTLLLVQVAASSTTGAANLVSYCKNGRTLCATEAEQENDSSRQFTL